MFARLALRLAAVEALRPSSLPATGPFPTLAGPRVYDSRQDLVDVLALDERAPIIVVYTDETTAEPYGSGLSMPDHVTVTLSIEIMLAMGGTVTVQGPDGTAVTLGAVGAEVAEPHHEMLLDLLEATVRRRLEARADVSPAGQVLRGLLKQIRQISSQPLRDEERTMRFAARSMTFRCVVAADQWPDPSTSPATLTGLAALPEPLRSVALALPAGSYGRTVCDDAARLLAQPGALTAFLGATAAADVTANAATASAGTADMTVTLTS